MVNGLPENALHQLQSILGLPDNKIDVLRDVIKMQTCDANTHFVRAGDITTDIAFVLEGVFRFYYISFDGDDVTKSFCAEGDFIGVYSALIQNEPAAYSIEALETGKLLTIPFDAFLALSQSDMDWHKVHLKLVEQLYMKKERRERQLLLFDATTRYLEFLKSYPSLEQRVKQYHIASYLGVTPVTLSRIRAQIRSTH